MNKESESRNMLLENDQAVDIIKSVFGCETSDIKNSRVLKKGMTNHSYYFECFDNKYLIRVPGEGTSLMIDRKQEAEVYETISGFGLCDSPEYIDPVNGFKITKYLNDVRVCDTDDENDLILSMNKLKGFHALKLTVSHTFDIFDKIDFYESLWKDSPSIYNDYRETKEMVFGLKSLVDGFEKEWCLTHIDAVPDNFLFYKLPDGTESLQLTDWEYAGMQDPHVDIAMFCIYALYDKDRIDRLIDIYFDGKCDFRTRAKIYCYVSMCGLLWSNWCEYKRILGVEFGEYSLRQYQYAKDFCYIAMDMMKTGR